MAAPNPSTPLRLRLSHIVNPTFTIENSQKLHFSTFFALRVEAQTLHISFTNPTQGGFGNGTCKSQMGTEHLLGRGRWQQWSVVPGQMWQQSSLSWLCDTVWELFVPGT